MNAALIQGRRSLIVFALICGAKSGEALNRVNTVALKPSFHIIVHDRRIAGGTQPEDRTRLLACVSI